ncbi:TfoX/Sxy family protein [Vineibacter terrae]|uniref:TfoX/Sxy family protein n=1 Tax=Vineibacter terrae TaxID=2586908 RepID=UPI002E3743A7|nr:TfoX/Sxy family protein [Vineibacter terrae]HEX2889959.1 TfoX/Sxy family protein [Vineibacter terrae]
MAWRKAPPQLVSLFDSVVPRDPRVVRRPMFGYPAAFANGKLFASLFEDSVVLKLSPEDRGQLQAAHGASAFEPMPGRRMREYIVLPEALLSDRVALDRWLSRALDYVLSQSGATKKAPRSASPRKGKR